MHHTHLSYDEQERRLYLLGDTRGAALAASAGDIEEMSLEAAQHQAMENLEVDAFDKGKEEGIKEAALATLGEAGAALLRDAEEDAARVRKAYAGLYANFEALQLAINDGTLKLAPDRKKHAEKVRLYLSGRKYP